MRHKPSTIDKLITLAGGDVFAVQAAIREASAGTGRAALDAVVRIIVRGNQRRAATAIKGA